MGDVVEFPRKQPWWLHPPGPGGRWTKEQDDWLRECYANHVIEIGYIAFTTQRTEAAVRGRIHKLGLTRPEWYHRARPSLARKRDVS
jgi:hypothetical protein